MSLLPAAEYHPQTGEDDDYRQRRAEKRHQSGDELIHRRLQDAGVDHHNDQPNPRERCQKTPRGPKEKPKPISHFSFLLPKSVGEFG